MTNVALHKQVLEADVRFPESATDGVVTGYDAGKGYAAFPVGGTLTVDLETIRRLWSIRVLLWDGDDRRYTYRLLTSATGLDWELRHDASTRPSHGWQVFDFERPISARYIRIQGRSNTTNNKFHVVQLEAYDSPPIDLPLLPGFSTTVQTSGNILPGPRPFLLQHLWLPIVVAAAVTVLGVVVDSAASRFLAPRTEISYAVDGPVNYLADPAMANVELTVNGAAVEGLWGYRVNLRNTGDRPVSALPFRLAFASDSGPFEILSWSHQTQPPFEFGAIGEEKPRRGHLRFVYELLNPGDEDLITLVLSANATLDVYSKAEGVAIAETSTSSFQDSSQRESMPWYVGVVAALTGVLTMLASRWIYQRTISEWLRNGRI